MLIEHYFPGGNRSRAAGGFSMIELLTVMLLLVIFATIATPYVGIWAQQSRVRTGVESIQNALRQAQAEASKRNQSVEFFLTDAAPVADSTTGLNAAGAVDNGANWVVRLLPGKTFILGGELTSQGAKVSGGNNKTLIFSGIGSVFSGFDAKTKGIPLNATRVYTLSTSSNEHPMCVLVRPGGGVRWCDGSKSSGNPAACPSDITCAVAP